MSLMVVVKRGVLFLFVCYLLSILTLFLVQDGMVFPEADVNPNISDFKDCEISFSAPDGVSLQGWFVDRKTDTLLIYYGGNSEEVSKRVGSFKKTGYSFLTVNYRSYGSSGGHPTQELVFKDALKQYDFIRKMHPRFKNIVLMGRSLGTGVATYVSSKRDHSHLILVTPFDSVASVGQGRFPFIPIRLVLRHPFDSVKYIKGNKHPKLVFLSEIDGVVPHSHTKELIRHMEDPVMTSTIAGSDHINIMRKPEVWNQLLMFLRDNGGLVAASSSSVTSQPHN